MSLSRINLTMLTMGRTAPLNRMTMNQSNCYSVVDSFGFWSEKVLQCKPNAWIANVVTCTMATRVPIQISWSTWVWESIYLKICFSTERKSFHEYNFSIPFKKIIIQRMHPESYEQFLTLKSTHKLNSYSEKLGIRSRRIEEFEQNDFNRIVLDFMINGMHHPKLLEDPTFDTLLNGD